MADASLRIVKVCRKCAGTGFRVAGVQPLRFKPCNKCSGRGGRTESIPHAARSADTGVTANG